MANPVLWGRAGHPNVSLLQEDTWKTAAQSSLGQHWPVSLRIHPVLGAPTTHKPQSGSGRGSFKVFTELELSASRVLKICQNWSLFPSVTEGGESPRLLLSPTAAPPGDSCPTNAPSTAPQSPTKPKVKGTGFARQALDAPNTTVWHLLYLLHVVARV